MKYLRKEKARACVVHKTIMAKAIEHITDTGTFGKEAVLEDTGFGAMANAIRWDYIREFIEDKESGIGMELIPLSALFFNSTREEKRKGWSHQTTPEKYTALGHGKHTAGYAALGYSEDLDEICICSLRARRRTAAGTIKALATHEEQTNERITPRLPGDHPERLALQS